MNENPFEQIYGIASGYVQSSILTAAAELDLFTAIIRNREGAQAHGLAEELKTDLRGTEALLDALTAMGFLEKNIGQSFPTYSVTAVYIPYLDSGRDETLVPMLRQMANGLRLWGRLTWAVKEGKPQKSEPSILGAEQDAISFIQTMNTMAETQAEGIVATLQEAGVLSLSGHCVLLDVGGASGTYTQAFLQSLPEVTAIIFDLPVGIGQAKKRFEGSEYAGRVRYMEGDFLRDHLPDGGCDFAWLSAVIHYLNREEAKTLYRKVFSALNSDRMLAIRGYAMSPDRTSPKEGAIFGVNMVLGTPSGRVYTYDEVKEDLEHSGFIGISLAVPSETMSAVIIARKP